MVAQTKKVPSQKISPKMNPSVRVSFYVHEWIAAIEARLKEPASTQTCQDLFQELEITSTIIENAREKVPSLTDQFSQTQVSSRLQEAEEKIVCLYGRITDLSIDSEISSLQEEAKQLEDSIQRADVKEMSMQVDNLKEHIFTFCNQCSLPREKRKALRDIRVSIEKADAALSREQTLEVQDYQCEIDIDIDSIDEVSGFFDLAYLIFKEKNKEARTLYNQFTAPEKDLFHFHLKALHIENFSFTEHAFACIQALLACAYGLSEQNQTQKYLSAEEVALFFMELEESIQVKASY